MARRTRRLNNRNGNSPSSRRARGEPFLSYRTIVTGTVTFVLVALGGLFSHSLSTEGNVYFKSGGNTQGGRPIYYGNTDNVSNAILARVDAILVLGGGRPHTVHEPPVYVQRRCDDAAKLVHRANALQQKRKKKKRKPKGGGDDDDTTFSLPILTLSAGTAHVPQLLSSDGLPVWESTASAAYLAEQHQLPGTSLYVETTSYDTIGNAYYARTAHTDIVGWRSLLIITNEFHMNRTAAIFDWIFGLSGGGSSASPSPYELHYFASDNVGLEDDALSARREREMASLQTVRTQRQTYTTLAQVYEFLTSQHGLYTATKLVNRGAKKQGSEASDLVKKSYGGGSRRHLQEDYNGGSAPSSPFRAVGNWVGGLFRQ